MYLNASYSCLINNHTIRSPQIAFSRLAYASCRTSGRRTPRSSVTWRPCADSMHFRCTQFAPIVERCRCQFLGWQRPRHWRCALTPCWRWTWHGRPVNWRRPHWLEEWVCCWCERVCWRHERIPRRWKVMQRFCLPVFFLLLVRKYQWGLSTDLNGIMGHLYTIKHKH